MGGNLNFRKGSKVPDQYPVRVCLHTVLSGHTATYAEGRTWVGSGLLTNYQIVIY